MQFHKYCAPGRAEPVKVRFVVLLVKEAETQRLGAAKALTGVGFTVTVWVAIAETQAGEPGLATVKLMVLVPGVAQETVCGPMPCPSPEQPLQFQEKVAPGKALPVKESVVCVAAVAAELQIIGALTAKLLSGVGFTVTNAVATVEIQTGLELF